MSPEEKRAYQKGYEAGRRRRAREIKAYRDARERIAFVERAYLALLPAAMQVQGWKLNGEPVANGPQRISLAIAWANIAASERRRLRA